MKKLGFVILGIAIMLSSCVKENAPAVEDGGGTVLPGCDSSEELVEKVIKVSAPATRTALADTDGDGIKDEVVWTAGDQIAVWDGFACRKFVMTGEPKGNIAEFRGHVSAKSLNNSTTFYAVYPYSETFITEVPPTDTEEGVRGYARMLFPSSQYQIAKPGGFDKTAAFAIAESSDIENMTFTQKTSLLRFKLAADMNNVVAVKFQGNEPNDYIWGTVSMRFLDGGELYPGVINRKDVNPLGRGMEIIMRKEDGYPLLTSEDYYFAIPATDFGRGYRLTFVHSDETTSSRSSAKPIEFNTTRIYDLASEAVSLSKLHSYKADYEKNDKITICGYDCSKSAYGKPVLIEAHQEYTITTGGSYFIEPGARVTINTGDTPIDKLMIVGDNKFEKSQITQTSSVRLNNNGQYLHLNTDLTFNDGFDMVVPKDNNASINRIEFQDCLIRYDSSKSVLHSSTASVHRLAFYSNDIRFTKDTNIFFTSTDSGTPVYSIVIFDNNLFFHAENFDNQSYAFSLLNGDKKTIDQKISMSWNTFVNLKTNTLNPYYVGGNVTGTGIIYIHNNLFYLPYLGAGNHRLFNSDYNYGANEYGVTYFTGTDKILKYSSTAAPTGVSSSYQLIENPFENLNVKNGNFQKKASLYPVINGETYEIGAKRQSVIL